MGLQELRSKIDSIDNKIVDLYINRMDVVKAVGQHKKDVVMPVNQGDREEEILFRVTENVSEDLQGYTKELFTTLFETSKAYQKTNTVLNSKAVEVIKTALSGGVNSFPMRGTIACQGVSGSYSSIATKKLFEIPNIMYFKSFGAVFQAVESGFCEYGMLPIENSSVGSVNAVYDLMREHKFYIVKSISIPVTHNLLTKKGVAKNQIKEIVSHEQALNQCRKYLENNFKDVKITVCENTAKAAEMVASSDRTDLASISSKECQEIFGLEANDKNIQDYDNNYTRFICISKKFNAYENADKISFMSTLPHTPGSLNKFLTKFAMQNLNLTKMESRPLDGTMNKFVFYFDFIGDISDIKIQNLIAESENNNDIFEFLGSYSEVMA